MPHIILEHTPLPNSIDVKKLLQKLHITLAKQDSFDIQAIKSRAIPLSHYHAAENDPPFMHLTLAVLAGRTEQQLKNAGQVLFDILADYNKQAAAKTSLEIRQMDADFYWK